jgi:DNA polymerase III gamma/tau subunit
VKLSEIIAQSPQFLRQKSDIAEDRLSHAYVITAPDEVMGREFFSLFSKQALYKYGFTDRDTIDYKIDLGVHPDVKIIGGEEKISAEVAENLIADIYLKGMESDCKLYLLDAYAQPISPVVQNKLLKVFEEPPEKVSLFILTPNESALLTTINSRAKKITFPPVSEEQISQYLQGQGIDQESALICARISGGSPKLALNFAQDKERCLRILSECVRILRDCTHTSRIIEFLDSEALSKDNFAASLYFFEMILGELAQKLADGGRRARISGIDEIAGFGYISLAAAIKATHEARQKLALYIDTTSTAETMLFNILEAKYKWQ